MGANDRERWNARYTERGAATWEVDGFLHEVEAQLPRTGCALDLAGGSGRHALWLAQRGLDVTLLDVSDAALRLAAERAAEVGVDLACVQADLTQTQLPEGPWDLILDVHYLQRDLFEQIPRLLRPGGLFVFVQPTVRNLERHPKPSRRFLLEEGEIGGLVEGLEVLRLDEGWSAAGRHEVRLVAQKPMG